MPPPRLPALPGLRAFEAFARAGSMTAAAEELGVTHGAISRAIRALQLQVGAALVEGPRHQLQLTAAGRRLAEATGAAFAQIADALPGATTGEELYLSCYGTFAMKWLIPRLPDFLNSRPGAKIRIVEEHGPVDFARGHVQAAIRMDDAVPAGARFIRFMPQFHGPVLSPQVWEACGRDQDAALRLPRLVSETFLGSWDEWARGRGTPLPDPPAVQVFEHNSYMLEAAVAGLGIAIAPWSFAGADIALGRLMAPFGFRELPMRFAFIQPGAGNPLADAFGKWLQRQGRLAARPPNL